MMSWDEVRLEVIFLHAGRSLILLDKSHLKMPGTGFKLHGLPIGVGAPHYSRPTVAPCDCERSLDDTRVTDSVDPHLS